MTTASACYRNIIGATLLLNGLHDLEQIYQIRTFAALIHFLLANFKYVLFR